MVMEQCFAFFNAWSDALLDIIRRGGDWYELIGEGHRIFGNPMVIYNRSMRIMAYTMEDGTTDALWRDTVQAGVARVDTQGGSEDMMRLFSEMERHDAPFRFEGEGMSDPFWCAPVRVGETACGMVQIIEFQPIYNLHIAVCSYIFLGFIFGTAIARDLRHSRLQNDSFLIIYPGYDLDFVTPL